MSRLETDETLTNADIVSMGIQAAIADRKKSNEEEPQGTKHDENKLRYDLIPPHALAEVVKVLTRGAAKYGEYNWDKGIKFSRLYAAAQRHLQAWYGLQDKDPETEINHLAHAICSLLFLLSFQTKKSIKAILDLDDRHNYF